MKRKTMASAAFMTAAMLSAAACAPVKILNAITPSASFEKDKNVSYGPFDRQKLDIYRAETSKPASPLLVFVHGGSWDSGSKDLYKFLAEGFTSEGYDVVVPNYRLYPEVKYPAFVEDTAKAIAFTAEKFPDRPLVVMGHSAGGYNMLMAMMRPNFYPSDAPPACRSVAGLVSLAGPTGIIALGSEPYITMFPERMFGSDAPMNNVKLRAGSAAPQLPPVFFGHGLKDTTVYPQNSEKLAAKIIAAGGAAVVKTYEGLGHTDVVKVLSRHFDDDAELKADILTFIEGLDMGSGPYCG
jgi:acetyl esterase/lipase